jgi:hypothetical protein
MTTVLSSKHHKKAMSLVLSPDAFKQMLEKADPDLIGFFDEMCNAILPNNLSASARNETKKKVVVILHLIAGIRSMHANSFKLELGLYLEACGTSCGAINTLSNAGLTVTYKTVCNNKNRNTDNHTERVKEYFAENVSVFQEQIRNCKKNHLTKLLSCRRIAFVSITWMITTTYMKSGVQILQTCQKQCILQHAYARKWNDVLLYQ